jgi:hypothetical protein
MKRSTKRKELQSKLKGYTKELEDYDKERFKEDGSVNFETALKIQKVQNDMYHVTKQINFLRQGKSHLGDSIGQKSIKEFF